MIRNAPMHTPYKERILRRNDKITEEFLSLSKNGNMKTAVVKHLMQKYKIETRATVYRIVRHTLKLKNDGTNQ